MPNFKTTLLTVALSLGLSGAALAGHGKDKDAGAMLERWPDASKQAAKDMIRKYGQPDEVTRNRLIWHDNGIWERTIVNRDPTRHLFPKPHDDVLEQVVHLEIDPSFVDDLTEFDGSLYVDRTRGEISARCDREEANLIALNLAHDIVEGEKTVDEAREAYARHVMAMMSGEPTRYAQVLTFEPDPGMTNDPGETLISRSFLDEYDKSAEPRMREDAGMRDASRERAVDMDKGVEDDDEALRGVSQERTRDLALPVEREDILRDTDRPPNIVPKDADFDEQWEEVEPGVFERKEPTS